VWRLLPASALAALALAATVPSAGGPAAKVGARLVQAPAAGPGAPRVMAFSWTLYPRMWAEIDLRLAAGAETIAEVTAEDGEVSWNLHVHPVEASSTFVTLREGVAARATVRCAPDADGRYSYLFGNDRNTGPVRLRVELRLSGDARLEAVRP
jgi:hypothetical protein